MTEKSIPYDLCIIGGGINGACIARDAAGRGLSVILLEQNDLASATSNSSTKLIHGGLRYLEYYEFKLVREALKERQILLDQAPHIMWPMQFILPHDKTLRPAWLIRLGLFLYDHLGGQQSFAPSKLIHFATHPAGEPLVKSYKKGFRYSDGWVDDARFVVLNALAAKEHGAEIYTHTSCTGIKEENGLWQITAYDKEKQQERGFTSRMVVNAAGPWVRSFMDHSDVSHEDTPQIRLVKGSHIVVPRLFDGQQAYILQQPDRRIVFAIPYEGDFTLIGTTDVEVEDDPANVKISDSEIKYLCDAVNRSFEKKIGAEDVVWTYSGVRPLLDDEHNNASAVTRDYKLILDMFDKAPLLSVFGGKITTARKLAENAVDDILDVTNDPRKSWTKSVKLPGGEFGLEKSFDEFLADKEKDYPFLPAPLLQRYARAYGTLMDRFLSGKDSLDDLGTHYGDGLYEAEIRYLTAHEWARTAEDILWRRTKCGLKVSPETVHNLETALKTI